MMISKLPKQTTDRLRMHVETRAPSLQYPENYMAVELQLRLGHVPSSIPEGVSLLRFLSHMFLFTVEYLSNSHRFGVPN